MKKLVIGLAVVVGLLFSFSVQARGGGLGHRYGPIGADISFNRSQILEIHAIGNLRSTTGNPETEILKEILKSEKTWQDFSLGSIASGLPDRLSDTETDTETYDSISERWASFIDTDGEDTDDNTQLPIDEDKAVSNDADGDGVMDREDKCDAEQETYDDATGEPLDGVLDGCPEEDAGKATGGAPVGFIDSGEGACTLLSGISASPLGFLMLALALLPLARKRNSVND